MLLCFILLFACPISKHFLLKAACSYLQSQNQTSRSGSGREPASQSASFQRREFIPHPAGTCPASSHEFIGEIHLPSRAQSTVGRGGSISRSGGWYGSPAAITREIASSRFSKYRASIYTIKITLLDKILQHFESVVGVAAEFLQVLHELLGVEMPNQQRRKSLTQDLLSRRVKQARYFAPARKIHPSSEGYVGDRLLLDMWQQE